MSSIPMLSNSLIRGKDGGTNVRLVWHCFLKLFLALKTLLKHSNCFFLEIIDRNNIGRSFLIGHAYDLTRNNPTFGGSLLYWSRKIGDRIKKLKYSYINTCHYLIGFYNNFFLKKIFFIPIRPSLSSLSPCLNLHL